MTVLPMKHGSISGPGDRLMFSWVLLGFILSLAIAFSDVAKAIVESTIVGAVIRLIPAVGKISVLARDPIHARAFFSCLWLVVPFLCVALFKQRDDLFPIERWQRASGLLLIGSGFLSAMLLTTVIFLPGISSKLQISALWTGSLALIVKTPIHVGIFGSLVMFFPFYVTTAFATFLSRIIKHGERR